MIEYFRGPYGANLLFRWHGSALAKAFIPGLLAVAIYLAIHFSMHPDGVDSHASSYENKNDALLNHPYAVGVLVSSVSFLIIFRANYGYQRYWEACSTVHMLMSKWMDAAVYSSVFHLQSEHYNSIKPPSFYDHDDLNAKGLTRDREVSPLERRLIHNNGDNNNYHYNHGGTDATFQSEEGKTTTTAANNINNNGNHNNNNKSQQQVPSFGGAHSLRNNLRPESSASTLRRRRYNKSINETVRTIREHSDHDDAKENEQLDESHLLGPGRLDGGWGKLFPNEINGTITATYYDIAKLGPDARKIPTPSNRKYDNNSSNNSNNSKHSNSENNNDDDDDDDDDKMGFASTKGGRTPSLFLQELAHLSSLLCAVALTTLRNDLEDVESPLGIYVPGQPWPEADPHYLPKDVKRNAYQQGNFLRTVRYLLGMDQTKASRTRYNAARPMLVIGGVSDNEIAFLQRARGPYAKVQLVWNWLSDFIIREHLAGSLGKVGPPIVSRVVQFMSDGTLYYNHARKIMFTPFPFPHAQLSAFFVLVVVIIIPFLMDQYTNEVWLGATLSFLTVTCLAGLHEVARELENPFRNAPNDVPLCTLLAFYNEALITMFAGYHPDSYWNEAEAFKKYYGVVREEEEERKSPNEEGGQEVDQATEKRSGSGEGDDTPDLSDETEATTLVEDDKSVDHNPAEEESAVPQSLEGDDSLKKLREMIESQAAKIKELQERMHQKEMRRTTLDDIVGASSS